MGPVPLKVGTKACLVRIYERVVQGWDPCRSLPLYAQGQVIMPFRVNDRKDDCGFDKSSSYGLI